MNRQRGMSSLALVLLLLVLGTLILTGLNQQLQTFSTLVSGESLSVRQQAAVQSALEWGRVQEWALQPEVQCKQIQRLRVCIRLFGARVLLIAGNDNLLLWRGGDISEGQIRFSAHGWSDFCPLKESTLCQLP
ncbi:DUF2509 family protein [Enterobacter hormaechei subsp. steigerwaltii]|uniref:DUF2509 family protein n=1 Tax=Enterobacter hormaechei TaxID=158836 RepID=UPI000F84CF6E|nr:DUF2509 family protein [Enterobacter hormaechei]RTY41833.1 DUF2509 family protein [Enterobacter hormaechei subsp. steigerwaltii]